jgi:glycosyl transferase family 11
MIVTLQGGHANQLFQMAFGLSVAKVRKEDVFFTRNRVDADVKRSYSLDAYQVGLNFVKEETKNKFYDGGNFNLDVYTAPKDTTFIGYWQTEKFIDTDLIRDLTLRQMPSEASLRVSDEIRAVDNSVFIHVRRGDYVKEKHTSEFHGNLGIDYYGSAIGLIRESMSPNFFIFSDDPNWCRTAFPEFRVVDHNRLGNGHAPGDEHEDLWLMSLCRHAIIANSAFSWWGAWMGDQRRGRMVIAPKQWFRDPSAQSADIVPDRWIKI